MCDPTRRSVLRASAAAVALLAAEAARSPAAHAAPPLPAGRQPSAAPQPPIHPRQAWARGLAPTGAMRRERDGDVRFLLVHHTQTPNGYAADAVPARLRSIFEYHTGPKGWPDVAYNFFVDAHGGIWEGRAGSLAGPVMGDATGGSQGFAQLCCFIGDHTATPPTAKAQAAMASLLAWLAGRYGIDLHAGETITFVSRGSNRWPRGTTVTTSPVAAHRDMSLTECPGDAAYPLVQGSLLAGAQRLAARPAPVRPPTTAAPAPTAAPTSRAPAPTRTERITRASSPPAPTVSPAASPASSDIVSPSATATRTLATPQGMPSPAISTVAQPPPTKARTDNRLPLVAAGLIAAGVAAGGAAFTSHRRHATEDAPGHAELEPPPDEG